MSRELRNRIYRLERDAPPRQVVMRWLKEIHEWPSAYDYARADAVLDEGERDVERLWRQARPFDRGKLSPEALELARRQRWLDILFLRALALNLDAECRRQGTELALRSSILLLSDIPIERRPEAVQARHNMAERFLCDVAAVERARIALECRFLRFDKVLFADTRAVWDRVLDRAIYEAVSSPPSLRTRVWLPSTHAAAEAIVQRLIDEARVTVLLDQGYAELAHRIVRGQLINDEYEPPM